MIMWRTRIGAAGVAAFAILAAGCDSGEPSRTPDELAADSALAADLALANRDTLLVDSIGAYREPDAAERDTGKTAEADTTRAPTPAAKTASAPPPPAPVIAQPAPTPAPTPAATNTAPAAAKPAAPRLTGIRACTSPTLENQNECLRASIASADARLNRIYRALITEMRLQEKVGNGASDPASVQRLRIAQRQWVVYRDNECRKKVPSKERGLWAKARASCLADFAGRRANELADDFSKLTAH
jgi:uncharacterized protein YecT (DUF1311 family)